MLLIIADMDSIGEFQGRTLPIMIWSLPCFQKSMLSRYGQMVLDILADIGLHKELQPFRQDKGLLMALLADMYEKYSSDQKGQAFGSEYHAEAFAIYQRQYHRGTDGTEGGKRVGYQSVLSVPYFSSQLNISFPSYVAQQRMILACNLLKDSRKTGDRDQLRMRIS